MKIQHYFTLLVLVTVVALIGVAEWSQSQQSKAENRSRFFTTLESQTANFEQMLATRVQALRSELAQAASRHSEAASSLFSDSSFSAIAWLEQNPAGAAAKYKAVWAESNTQTFDPSWLKSLNLSRIKDGESIFARRVDRNGDAFYAIVMTAVAQAPQSSSLPEQMSSSGSSGRVYLFGAISPSVLSAWVDDWVGSNRAAFVFDENGNVVSHSLREFAGTNLMKDSFVNASVRSGRGQLTHEYTDMQGEDRIAESMRLARTNLKVAISAPKLALVKQTLNQSSSSKIFSMLVAGLILVIATYFFSGSLAKRYLPKPALVKNTPEPAPQAPAVEAPIQIEVMNVIPEPELTFEMVEQKTRVNIDEILARSVEIRKRLQLDFVESIAEEQNLILQEIQSPEPIAVDFEMPKAEILVANEPSGSVPSESLPKVKVRRPKVSL